MRVYFNTRPLCYRCGTLPINLRSGAFSGEYPCAVLRISTTTQALHKGRSYKIEIGIHNAKRIKYLVSSGKIPISITETSPAERIRVGSELGRCRFEPITSLRKQHRVNRLVRSDNMTRTTVYMFGPFATTNRSPLGIHVAQCIFSGSWMESTISHFQEGYIINQCSHIRSTLLSNLKLLHASLCKTCQRVTLSPFRAKNRR